MKIWSIVEMRRIFILLNDSSFGAFLIQKTWGQLVKLVIKVLNQKPLIFKSEFT